MNAGVLLVGFCALVVAILLFYALHPGLRADVDRDTANRRSRRRTANMVRKQDMLEPAKLIDAELWPDPPADPAAYDRWMSANGLSEQPRPQSTSRD